MPKELVSGIGAEANFGQNDCSPLDKCNHHANPDFQRIYRAFPFLVPDLHDHGVMHHLNRGLAAIKPVRKA
jgi:hypothetical protein